MRLKIKQQILQKPQSDANPTIKINCQQRYIVHTIETCNIISINTKLIRMASNSGISSAHHLFRNLISLELQINTLSIQIYIQNMKSSKHIQSRVTYKSRVKEEQNLQKFQAIRYSQYQSLKLLQGKKYYKQLDKNFVQDINKIAETKDSFIKLITNNNIQLTQSQCQEIHYLAKLHKEANIVNQNTKVQLSQVDPIYKCQCGCKRARGKSLNYCCPQSQLQCLGSGVVLFHHFEKGLAINLLFAVLIFSIFTTYFNFSQGNNPSVRNNCLTDTCSFISNSSSMNNVEGSLGNIEYILGISFCIFWVLSLRFTKYLGKKTDEELDGNLKSSSDFTIKINKLPFGQYNEKEIIDYFQRLKQNQIRQNTQNSQTLQSNGMKSIQIIYNMEFCRSLIDKIKLHCFEISKLVKQKKGQYVVACDNIAQYKQLKQNITQTYEIMGDLRKKFINDSTFRKKLATQTCLIQFDNEKEQERLLQKYGKEKIGLLKQIQAIIINFFCPSPNNILFHGKVLQIERAPQPSDILWLNCQKKHSTSRLLFIYFVTFVIILISFGLLLGLQYMKIYIISSNKHEEPSLLVQAVSLGTTIALQIVNKVLWIALYFLLDLQYNHTLTNKIVSLMNKALFATCVNILILPIIVYVEFQDDLHGYNGLVGFVFNYHVSVLTVGLALKLFNPIDLIVNLALSFKPLRNKILRFFRKKYGESEDEAFMRRIYKLYEGQYFDIAQSYIFIITNVFHAVFYCHLSPILLVFALAEIFLYLWINKIKIIKFFQIPQITQILVFDTAIVQASLVPIIYGCGSHFIGYFENGRREIYETRTIFQLVAMGVGVIAFFNPKNVLGFINSIFLKVCLLKDSKGKVQNNEDGQQTNAQLIKNKVSQDKIKNNQVIKPQPSTQLTRLENYYDNSNSVKLFGFQQFLQQNTTGNEFGVQLQYFCEHFFPQSQINCDEQIKQKIVDHFNKFKINNKASKNEGFIEE